MNEAKNTCGRCQRPIDRGAKFCPGCGKRLDAGTMEFQTCPECDRKLPDQAKFCSGCGTSLKGPTDPNLGRVIKKAYRLDRLLGKGATGRVYLAEQLSLKKKVAVKLLDADYAADKVAKARFEREALASSRLAHPNSIMVNDFGETDDGSLFLVMEYVEGDSLAQIIADNDGLPVQRAIEVLIQVCSALYEAHEQGVIHRDLKPENIMVLRQRDGRELVKVCDFGIARIVTGEEALRKITRYGLVCGTPEYMSPEQARNQTLDRRTDVYSLAVVMYETLTGSVPFEDVSALKVAQMHLQDFPEPFRKRRPDLDLPMPLEMICFKAMSKDRGQRHQSALEFQRALEEARRVLEFGETPDPAPAVVGPTPAQKLPAGFTPAPFRYTPPAAVLGSDSPVLDDLLPEFGEFARVEPLSSMPQPQFDAPGSVGSEAITELKDFGGIEEPVLASPPAEPLPSLSPVSAAPVPDPTGKLELDYERSSMETADTGHARGDVQPEVWDTPAEPIRARPAGALDGLPRWVRWLALGLVAGVIGIVVIELGEPPAEELAGPWRPPPDMARVAAERLHGEGLELLRDEAYNRAADRFRAALRSDPTLNVAHRDLGTAYASMALPGKALRQFRLYLRATPRAADAPQVKAMIAEIQRLQQNLPRPRTNKKKTTKKKRGRR